MILLTAPIRPTAIADEFVLLILIKELDVIEGCLQLLWITSIILLFSVTLLLPSGFDHGTTCDFFYQLLLKMFCYFKASVVYFKICSCQFLSTGSLALRLLELSRIDKFLFKHLYHSAHEIFRLKYFWQLKIWNFFKVTQNTSHCLNFSDTDWLICPIYAPLQHRSNLIQSLLFFLKKDFYRVFHKSKVAFLFFLPFLPSLLIMIVTH